MWRLTLLPAWVLSFAALPLPLPLTSRARGQGPARAREATAPVPDSSTDLSLAKPGRDPRQPIDDAYTKKIREYTTEPFFLSPLVDYLPASATVPTPVAAFGDIAGAPTTLPDSRAVYAYMRLLAQATPRVRVYSIGWTEEGREMIAVAIASDSLLAALDTNRTRLAALADPRTIDLNDARADTLVAQSTPVYYITGAIHSTESGAPTALAELAYRLAVDESPYIRNIRQHVITLITPIVEVDGRDREADIIRWHFAHPGETYPPLVYWGHYVAHDNNRDALGLTLKLSQNVLNTYVEWRAQVLHDLHESVPFLYDNTVGDGPYNAWLDPLLTNEWQMLGWNNVQEMTRFGMPGVFTHGEFDTWSPSYLMFMAATHNGISRLYETFGNGGTPETLERTLQPDETSRTWWRQDPPLPRVRWSLRDNNNYEETGLLVSLSYIANNRHQILEDFYEKSKRSILKARTEGPAAYVLSAADPRPGAQAELLRTLQRQHVEISRTSAAFSVALPVTRPLPARDAAGVRAEGATRAATETRSFPAGSFVIRMDQPYSRIADAMLDHEYWSPNDPQKTPYDDTGWCFPELFGVGADRVTDPHILDVPMARVSDTVRARGGVEGPGAIFAIAHNGDNALATLRYRLRTADIVAAESPFEAAGHSFDRGSFLIRGVAVDQLAAALRDLGLVAYALPSAPAVTVHPVRAARVAIVHSWLGTQTEGWWRETFDFLHIPYTYISVQDVARETDLSTRFDVILFPPVDGSVQSIVRGLPMWRNPLPWKHTALTPNIGTWAETDDIRPGLGLRGIENLQGFVTRGGVLVGVMNTAELAVAYGLTDGVDMRSAPRGHVVGSVLRSRIVDSASPIAYGIRDSLAIFSADGQVMTVRNIHADDAGEAGAGAGADTVRVTGRGSRDDPDAPQGRPALDTAHEALVPPRVDPWEAPAVTEEQLHDPVTVIPPADRPRVVLRLAGERDLLVSGLLEGGAEIAERPIVVDVPAQRGHVVLFAMNPIYRGETVGSYFLVFNTLLNFDNLNAGRKLDAR